MSVGHSAEPAMRYAYFLEAIIESESVRSDYTVRNYATTNNVSHDILHLHNLLSAVSSAFTFPVLLNSLGAF